MKKKQEVFHFSGYTWQIKDGINELIKEGWTILSLVKTIEARASVNVLVLAEKEVE